MHLRMTPSIIGSPILMRKKPFLCFFLFLCSCTKIDIPSDIASLIYSPSLAQAMEKVKTLSATNENTIKDKEGKEIGRETYRISVNRASQIGYSYHRVDTYYGSRISLDSKYSSLLYLTEREIDVSFRSEKAFYVAIVKLTGSLEKGGPEESKTYTYQYTEAQMQQEIDAPIFYATEVSGRYQGGYYLADFFKSILSELDSMKAVENNLVYSFQDKIYKSGSQSAKVSETLIMNDFGMLKRMEQHAENRNTGDVSDSETNVLYNS